MEFDIVHRRGVLHKNADALSRYPYPSLTDQEQRYRWVCVPVTEVAQGRPNTPGAHAQLLGAESQVAPRAVVSDGPPDGECSGAAKASPAGLTVPGRVYRQDTFSGIFTIVQ